MTVTNSDIREFLGLPKSRRNFSVSCVDALYNSYCSALMFINRNTVDLTSLDSISTNCIYLIDDTYYPEIFSDRDMNDFIRVKNPKFKFCKIVEEFHLSSRLQIEFRRGNSYEKYRDRVWNCFESILGENVHIDGGAIIGGTDFSPVLGDDGELVQFPQLGGVKIGNDVVIKYNTMVGRGTFGFTTIGDNTQIDFGCQIGHNCQIGKRCIIAAGTIIGGSTVIGDGTVIGIGATIRNGLKIGQNASIGMGAVVIRDVPDNAVVVGNPAREIEHKQIFDEKGLV